VFVERLLRGPLYTTYNYTVELDVHLGATLRLFDAKEQQNVLSTPDRQRRIEETEPVMIVCESEFTDPCVRTST